MSEIEIRIARKDEIEIEMAGVPSMDIREIGGDSDGNPGSGTATSSPARISAEEDTRTPSQREVCIHGSSTSEQKVKPGENNGLARDSPTR